MDTNYGYKIGSDYKVNSLLKNSSMFSRKKDENNSLYEYYARKNGLQGKSLLILTCLY